MAPRSPSSASSRQIPLFGWCLVHAGMIRIDREGGARALRGLIEDGRAALARGAPIVIFPEGTRMPPGERRPYQPGVAALYRHLDCPVVPVALNSGVFWSRRSFVKRPGRIVVEFLPPIAPGLERKEFMAELERRLEGATERAGRGGAGRAQRRLGVLQRLRERMQRAVDDAHGLEVADRAQQIVATVAGAAGAAPDQVEQPVRGELSGILWMLAPDHVAPGGHPLGLRRSPAGACADRRR